MTIKTTTPDTFQADVLDAAGVVLVGYYIDGLPNVDSLMLVLQSVETEYSESVTICKVDCTGQDDMMIEKSVNVLPMVVAYKNGEKLIESRQPPKAEWFHRVVKANL
jgi:thioredoxin 1